ncbi:MAG: hypothetical protein AAFV95_12630 [Bacteroidota bacterium]
MQYLDNQQSKKFNSSEKDTILIFVSVCPSLSLCMPRAVGQGKSRRHLKMAWSKIVLVSCISHQLHCMYVFDSFDIVKVPSSLLPFIDSWRIFVLQKMESCLPSFSQTLNNQHFTKSKTQIKDIFFRQKKGFSHDFFCKKANVSLAV